MSGYQGWLFLVGSDTEGWSGKAACSAADPAMFFPSSSEGVSYTRAADAKAICWTCPVREDCLDFALETRQEFGIWGGLTPKERASERALRSGRSRSRRKKVAASS